MPLPATEAAANAEWVFIGRQVGKYEVSPHEQRDTCDRVRLEIEFLSVYKGDVPNTLDLATGGGSADCGVDLRAAANAKRKTTVETVFGNVKANLRFRRLSRRGLAATSSKWRLVCTVHNLPKIHQHRLPATCTRTQIGATQPN